MDPKQYKTEKHKEIKGWVHGKRRNDTKNPQNPLANTKMYQLCRRIAAPDLDRLHNPICAEAHKWRHIPRTQCKEKDVKVVRMQELCAHILTAYLVVRFQKLNPTKNKNKDIS